MGRKLPKEAKGEKIDSGEEQSNLLKQLAGKPVRKRGFQEG